MHRQYLVFGAKSYVEIHLFANFQISFFVGEKSFFIDRHIFTRMEKWVIEKMVVQVFLPPKKEERDTKPRFLARGDGKLGTKERGWGMAGNVL